MKKKNAIVAGLARKAKAKTKAKATDPLLATHVKALVAAKAEQKAATSKVRALESVVRPILEGERIAACRKGQAYVSSYKSGLIQLVSSTRHSTFDPYAEDEDGDQAIEVIAAELARVLKVSEEEATNTAETVLDIDQGLALAPGALDDPELVKILQSMFAEYLVIEAKAKPTKTFSQEATYDPAARQIMDVLNGLGHCKRAASSLKEVTVKK